MIWLRATPEALADRLGGSGDRPLLAGEEPIVVLQRLLAERSELYRAVATHEIDTDELGAAEATTRLVEIWTEQK